jgi:hypothetical protein
MGFFRSLKTGASRTLFMSFTLELTKAILFPLTDCFTEGMKFYLHRVDVVGNKTNKRNRNACHERVERGSGSEKVECGAEHQRNAGAI